MLATIGWLLLAALHLLPALALFRPASLTKLYGIAPGSTSFLLVHHRAALFLAVVVVALWAAARIEVRPLATVVLAISMIAFLILYRAAGSPPPLRSIAVADLIALPVLLFVAWDALLRTP